MSSTSLLPITRGLALARALSLATALLMTAASVAGLVYQKAVYPTDELLQSFVPNDAVNLLIGVPILLVSMWLTSRGKLIGLLFWPGALFYVVYSYLVYVFSMPLNAVFLLALTLVVLSTYTLLYLIAAVDGQAVQKRLAGAVPERAGGGVLAVLGLLFFLRVLGVLVPAMLAQASVAATERALLVSDFLITPAWVIGGWLLWRRQAFGYVAGLGLLFQASMLFVGLIFVLLIRPLITTAPFVLTDVVVIFVMGLVCFIPFALFVRGAASR